MNNLVKAQLDSFEALVFPEKPIFSHDASSKPSSCNLHPNELLALDLAGRYGLRVPQQPLDRVRRQRPTLSGRGDLHRYQRRYTAGSGRQHNTDGDVISQSIEADQNIHDANGLQTVSSIVLEPKPAETRPDTGTRSDAETLLDAAARRDAETRPDEIGRAHV